MRVNWSVVLCFQHVLQQSLGSTKFTSMPVDRMQYLLLFDCLYLPDFRCICSILGKVQRCDSKKDAIDLGCGDVSTSDIELSSAFHLKF